MLKNQNKLCLSTVLTIYLQLISIYNLFKMKKSLLSLALIATIGLGAVITPSCKKYEEGPGISLKSKKGRITGVWKSTKDVDIDGKVYLTDANDKATMEIKKDGTLIINSNDPTFPFSFSGTWAFANKKEFIEIKFGNDISKSEIILLKNKEMGFKDADGYKSYYEKVD